MGGRRAHITRTNHRYLFAHKYWILPNMNGKTRFGSLGARPWLRSGQAFRRAEMCSTSRTYVPAPRRKYEVQICEVQLAAGLSPCPLKQSNTAERALGLPRSHRHWLHVLDHAGGELAGLHLGCTLQHALEVVSHLLLLDGLLQRILDKLCRLMPAHEVEHHHPR